MIDIKTLNEDYVDQITAAKMLDVTQSRISQLCQEGRFEGATKIGWSWIIPKISVEKYTRRKSGPKPTRQKGKSDKAIWEQAIKEASNLIKEGDIS